MASDRIRKALGQLFADGARIVFWHDPDREMPSFPRPPVGMHINACWLHTGMGFHGEPWEPENQQGLSS